MKICLLDADWYTHLSQFKGAQRDHVRVESSSCCFPRGLESFDPWHLTCSSPIGRCITVFELGSIKYNVICFQGVKNIRKHSIESLYNHVHL